MYPEIQILNYTFTTYTVAALFSAATGFALSLIFAKKLGYNYREFFLVFLGILITFPIGARMLNVILNYDYYSSNLNDIISLSFRGFSVIGGIFASIFICFILHKFIGKNPLSFLDALSIPFIISFSIMKLGCFANGCCYGKATSTFIGVIFPNKDVGIVNGLLSIFNSFSGIPRAVYPTQLFESFLAILFIPIFIIVKKFYNFNKAGEIFLITGIYFTALRLAIHPFRDFPYPIYIVSYIYPSIYLLIIIVGINLLKKIRKTN
ncbi:MAG: prolipoprotein diacylglyceryl transferase family protein [Acidaminobacteraceae bacterium]